MKILSIGNFGHGWDGSICDEEHIAGALEELGHTVYRVQREEASGIPLSDKIPDWTLIAQWDGYGDLSHLPKPLVYWAFDYQADGQEWHERLVAEADLYLSKRIADSKYSNWQWLAQDFAPAFLGKAPTVDKDIDVLFTGSYLPWATERNETLKAVDKKFNLVIHSVNEWPGFKNQRGPIMDEGLPELYARAKIVLSIDHTIEAGYWSDRNAQAMCCEAFVLFRYVPLSLETFKSNVQYFYNTEDCLRKIEKRLGLTGTTEDMIQETIRNSYAKSAYRYAQANLKVNHRVWDLLRIVEGIS